ncbi:MAG: amino-acid N-acetyltransferase, partial [Planctomycetes bacterium]|nr:amino-acid N-acetyltransferase [Planctomycetota bacterium]
MHRLTDLREILRYVPRFRDRLFVIAIDGAVVEDENFRNVLLDLALLKSLRIGVVLVHGAAHQILRLADLTKQQPSNLDGSGITDDSTLQLALFASSRVTYELIEGLDAADLHGVSGSFLVAHPAGILGGVDQQWTGKIERVQTELLRTLVSQDLVPVVSPVGADGEGRSYRLNSDHVAVEVAGALNAAKLIFLSTQPGITLTDQATVRATGPVKSAIDRQRDPPVAGLLQSLSLEEAEAVLAGHRYDLLPELASKLDQAVRAVKLGVPRVHLIDGRVNEGLLAEVFSNLGVGTMVHANEYQEIRRAAKRDARS